MGAIQNAINQTLALGGAALYGVNKDLTEKVKTAEETYQREKGVTQDILSKSIETGKNLSDENSKKITESLKQDLEMSKDLSVASQHEENLNKSLTGGIVAKNKELKELNKYFIPGEINVEQISALNKRKELLIAEQKAKESLELAKAEKKKKRDVKKKKKEEVFYAYGEKLDPIKHAPLIKAIKENRDNGNRNTK